MEIPKFVKEFKDVNIDGELRSATTLLMKPGDFCYVKATDQWAGGAVMMRCPKCNQPNAFPLKRKEGIKRFFLTMYYLLINQRGELLTMEPGLICSYCTLQFRVHHGEIIVL